MITTPIAAHIVRQGEKKTRLQIIQRILFPEDSAELQEALGLHAKTEPEVDYVVQFLDSHNETVEMPLGEPIYKSLADKAVIAWERYMGVKADRHPVTGDI